MNSTSKSMNSLTSVEKVVDGMRLRLSKHFIERYVERLNGYIDSKDCPLCKVLDRAFKQALYKINVLGRKVRVETVYNGIEIVLVAAPIKGCKKGIELVTVWSPTYNPK